MGAVVNAPAAAERPSMLAVHTYRVPGRRLVNPTAPWTTVPSGASARRLTGPSPAFSFHAKSAWVVVTRVRYGPRMKVASGGRSRYVDPYQTSTTTVIRSSAVVITSAASTRRNPAGTAPLGRAASPPRTSGITCSAITAAAATRGPSG